ncbi:MAG: LacI family DNA-binding transcriptional regulator [Verrucomicrobia bacterium]|nr:LacI family DNA-binding transcriptional regulator [Verrucomicrobiota bacterium]
MPKTKKSVTLKDIASKAGVSPGAVSFVLNNTHKKRRISKPTVDRVLKIARELGYVPNIAARNLRTVGPNNNTLVLAIVTSSQSPLHLVSHIFEGLQRCIRNQESNRHYVINIVTFEPGHMQNTPGFLDGTFFNAAIITNTQQADDEFLSQTELPYPSVVIGRTIPGYSCFVPSLNAGKVAADALIESGVKHPALLCEKMLTQATENRVHQFTETIETALNKKPLVIQSILQDEDSAYKAVLKALETGNKFDGLFAVHDSLATGAYLALKDKGILIPKGVKVVGIGDSEIAPFLDPPLSCAGAEESSVYEKAAALMLELINNPALEPKVLQTRARYIKRGSV